MSKLTHHDTDATLAAINTALRRADDLHWTDPAFLEWERGQVGEPDPLRNYRDGVEHTRYAPGPRHANRYAWGCHVRPMIQIFDDGEVGDFKRFHADDYPDQVTTSGPLMLGPEPDTIPGPPPLPVPSVLFDATPDMSVFNALARRARRPDDRYTFRISARPITGHVPQMVILDEAIGWAPAAAIGRFSEELANAFGAIRSLGALMPDHPAEPPAEDTDPRARALARRRSTQAWHTFTHRPERRRRGNH